MAELVGNYYLERPGLKAIETPLGIRLCAMGRLDDSFWPAILISKVDAGPIMASETDLWIDCSPANPNDPTPVDTGRHVCSFCGAPLLTN